jgi:hypothetical protein
VALLQAISQTTRRVYPGSAITGATSITFIGASTIHNTPPGLDPISKQAQFDEINAYNVLKGQPFTGDFTGHDRHGTTTLFADLNVLEGTVIADCHSNAPCLNWIRVPARVSLSQAAIC